jgi:uncharacterized protein
MIHKFRAELAPIEPWSPPPGRVRSGTPEGITRNAYASADGRLFAGFWQASPGSWEIVYTEWEQCHILSGAGRIIADDGSVTRLAPGDQIVIEPGFRGVWEVTETMSKYYVIEERPALAGRA